MPSRRGPILLLAGVIVATAISVILARRLDSLSRAYRELQVMATTLPAWQGIADSVARRRDSSLSVIGISLDSVDVMTAYIRRFGIRFDVGFFPDDRTKRLFRATKVPETIVVDYDGHVIHNHIGVLEPGPALDSVLTALFSTDTDSSSLVSALDPR